MKAKTRPSKNPSLTINVTKDNIAFGVVGSAYSCPIAIAAIDAGLREVTVDSHITFRYSDDLLCRKYEMNLPESALKFVDRFDLGRAVKPFSFKINLKKARRIDYGQR